MRFRACCGPCPPHLLLSANPCPASRAQRRRHLLPTRPAVSCSVPRRPPPPCPPAKALYPHSLARRLPGCTVTHLFPQLSPGWDMSSPRADPGSRVSEPQWRGGGLPTQPERHIPSRGGQRNKAQKEKVALAAGGLETRSAENELSLLRRSPQDRRQGPCLFLPFHALHKSCCFPPVSEGATEAAG